MNAVLVERPQTIKERNGNKAFCRQRRGSYNLSAAEEFFERLEEFVRESDGLLAKIFQLVREHLVAAVYFASTGRDFIDW